MESCDTTVRRQITCAGSAEQTCSWTTLWNAFKRIVAGHSEAEKVRMFFGTANEVYRLGLDPAAPR